MKNCVVRLQGEKVIPVGYELTEMGIIPSDWKIEQLGNLCSLKSGLSITSKDIDDSSSYRCFGGNGLRGYTKKYTHDGDFALIGRQGALCGNIQYVSGQFFASEHALVASPTKSVDPKWLSIYLETMNLNQYSESSAQPGLSAEKLRILKLITPNLNEQTAIANVLSDTDALITQLEQLIAKKQAIKTATMQHLLTGRTRLPQFAKHPNGCVKGYKSCELGVIPDDWNVYTFDDLIEFCSSGATPYRGNKNFYTGSIRWITSGELNYCVINDTLEKISDEAVKRSNLKIHPAGTFLMAITGLEAAGTRGACGIVGQPAATNQSCMAIYPNEKLLSTYLYHWYVYNGETLAFRYCQGTKQLSYTAGLLRTIPLYIPNMVEEQAAIATILSDMDSELSVLEQKIAKIREIKQGMMQQLLTGRIRLPLDHQP